MTPSPCIIQNVCSIINLQAIYPFPFDQVPRVHGHPISIQVANGLGSGLSSVTLPGAVFSATAPATARHAVGMDNESKKPQRKSSGRRADNRSEPGRHYPIACTP